MSSAFELQPVDLSTVGLGEPDPTRQLGPGFAEGIGPALSRGLESTAAKSLALVGEAATGYAALPAEEFDKEFGTNTLGWLTRTNDARWQTVQSLVPDPATTGAIGQFTYGLADTLPTYLAANAVLPGSGAAAVGFTQGLARRETAMREGVDQNTATGLGAIEGVSQGVAFALPPFVGSNLLTRALSGAAINTVAGLAQRASSYEVLKANGYDKMAEQYKPLEAEAIAMDASLGLVFGGVGHYLHGESAADAAKPEVQDIVPPSLIDHALEVSSTHHFELDTPPGIPANPQTRSDWVNGLSKATEDLVAGEPVDVAPAVKGDMEFVPRPPEITETELRDEIAPADETVDHGQHGPDEFRDFARPYPGTVRGVYQAIHDFLMKKEAETSSEHGLLVNNATGVVEDQLGSGDSHSITISPEMLSRLSDPASNYTGVHNHPDSSAPSPGDIAALGHLGLRAVGANGKNGSKYVVKLTSDMRRYFLKYPEFGPTVLGRIGSKYMYGVLKPLTEWVNAGRLTPEEGDRVTGFAYNDLMQEAGVIDYAHRGPASGELQPFVSELKNLMRPEIEKLLREEGLENALPPVAAGVRDRSVESEPGAQQTVQNIPHQIVADNPDLIVRNDAGEDVPASEILKQADDAEAAAKLDEKLIQAAASCYLRNGA